MELAISRHIGLYHNFELDDMSFFAIEHVNSSPRGGDIDKHLLKLETQWIFRLQATKSPGLNEQISFKPFL